MRFQPTAGLLIAMLVIALVVVSWTWRGSDLHVATPDESDLADAKAAMPPSVAELPASSVSSSPRPKLAATRPDALVESLRAKLTAAKLVPREVLLSFRSAEARERFLREAAAHGLEVLDTIPQLNTVRVRYSGLEGLRDSIAANPEDFANVEGNLWLTIPGTSAPPAPDPNNQGGRAPFGYSTLDAINAAGDRTHWGDKVTVAVLDTGVLAHSTFAEGQVTRLDLVNDGQPFNSHGTSVASIIGGQNPQAPGVAPGAQILDIRVAGVDGYSASETLAQGIVTAVDRGAQVINISLGGYGDSQILAEAVSYASQRGAVIVAAAGNDAYGQLCNPD